MLSLVLVTPRKLVNSPSYIAFNAAKCKFVQSLRRTSLECVPYAKDLSITDSRDLQWAEHAGEITSKANKTFRESGEFSAVSMAFR